MVKTARAGDFFMSPDEIASAIPNGANVWIC